MPRPPNLPPTPALRPRHTRRRAAVLGLLLAGALALPTAAQALAAPLLTAPVRAASAPQPAPAPGTSAVPGPVPSPAPAPSPNPTPGSGAAPKGGGSTNLPAPQPLPSPPGSTSSGPSWWDIPGQVEHAIDQWFGDLVKAALTPIMNLIGRTVLSNPDTTGGRTGQLWAASLVIADTCYVLFAVVGGLIVMTHETVQTRYALGQIAPRLVLGIIAANTSLIVIGKAIAFANALTQAVWGQPLDPAGIGNKILGYILASIFVPDGITQIFMVLFGLVLAVLAGAVLFSAALRTAGLMLLTFSAPLALSCHALPGLDAVAKLWWRAFAAVFAIQILQALTLILAIQTFFDPDGDVLGVPTSSGFTDLLVCGALFVILLKIPGWVLRIALGRQPRTGAMGLLKTAAAAAIGTAIGVPGVTSTRMLAGRMAGRALRARLGPGGGAGGPTTGAGGGPRTPRGPQPVTPARPARPNFGAARGRPGPGGQLPLFPLPPGARQQPPMQPNPPHTGPGAPPAGPGGMPSPMPGWVQPTLFSTAPPMPPGPGRQLVLFPAARARRATPSPAPSATAQAAAPPTTSSPGWRQPALFPPDGRLPQPPAALHTLGRGRQLPLFTVPADRRVPRTPAVRPAPAPPPPATGYEQLMLFTRRPPRSRATPPATPTAVARTVPVRLPDTTPRPAAKTRSKRKGGDA